MRLPTLHRIWPNGHQDTVVDLASATKAAPIPARERIQARRNALAMQLEQAKQQYAQLEQTLAQLDRSMCAMQGGIQELTALLEEPCDDSPPS